MEQARGWLDPLLHGARGQPAATREPAATGEPAADGAPAAPDAAPDAAPGDAASEAASEAEPDRDRRCATVVGKRVVTVLLAVFVLSVVVLCVLNAMRPVHTSVGQGWVSTDPHPTPLARATSSVSRATVAPRPPATSVCPQYAGNVAAATGLDAATAARVDTAWERIERWLAAHAPATGASLRSPAPPERIAALQTRMSVAFPPDLVASLRRHDGVAARDGFSLPPFYQPLPLDQIVGNWEVTCGVLGRGPVDHEWWHRAFVPFATAGDGGCLLVDQRPGGHGRVGEFYPEDGTGFDRWPASVVELLEGVALALESGKPYAGRYRPVVNAGGRLDWEV